jgi:hypothetical protein
LRVSELFMQSYAYFYRIVALLTETAFAAFSYHKFPLKKADMKTNDVGFLYFSQYISLFSPFND